MSAQEVAVVAALSIVYAVIGLFLAWGVARLCRRFPPWLGRVPTCFILALFFAPSVIGAGHGGGIGPAWIVLVQMHPLRLGVTPILVTFAVFYGLVSATAFAKSRNKVLDLKRQEEQR